MHKINNNKPHWIIGFKDTDSKKIPVVSTKLSTKDILSGWIVRWRFYRMNYKIKEGLYCIGEADNNSPVFVTANYKLTFDRLRKELHGINAWILVLDTKGVNVWCAAGKGTFGTIELTKRIRETNLEKIVKHKNIIVPQLGATGVSAHIVKKLTGFKVTYGPVEAKDIKVFLKNNFVKTDEMRIINFKLKDRLAVTPTEIVMLIPATIIILAVSVILNFIKYRIFGPALFTDFIPFIGALFIGSVIVPALLPILPFRSFALKGAAIGLIWAVLISLIDFNYIKLIFNIMLLTPLISFIALNYTGNSTFTSLTGVKIEVKIATPIFILSILLGSILKILNSFNII